MGGMDVWLKWLWAKVRRVNWAVLLATVLLAAAGVLFVKSACASRPTEALRSLWVGQLGFAIRGFALMWVLALWDYRRWARFAPWVYLGVLAALVLVPCCLIILQQETGSALVFASLIFVLYREGLSGLFLFYALCAIVYFVVAVKYSSLMWGAVAAGEVLVFILIFLVVAAVTAIVLRLQKSSQTK